MMLVCLIPPKLLFHCDLDLRNMHRYKTPVLCFKSNAQIWCRTFKEVMRPCSSGLRFLTWAQWSFCSNRVWIPRLSARGESTICLKSSIHDCVDFDKAWNTSASLVREHCASSEPPRMSVWKLLHRSSSLLLCSSITHCWRLLLRKDETSWLKSSVLTLQSTDKRDYDLKNNLLTCPG